MRTTTVQELLLAVAEDQRDLIRSTTTFNGTGLTTKMMDSAQITNRDRWQQNGELFFLDSPAGQTGTPPYVIRDFESLTGTFTLDKAFGAAPVGAGVDYAIVRTYGQKNPYRAYIRALEVAFERCNVANTVEDASLVSASGVYDYTIPNTLDTVSEVVGIPGTYPAEDFPSNLWDMRPGRKLRLSSDLYVAYPFTIRLTGRKFINTVTGLTQSVTVDNFDDVVQTASEWLNRTSNSGQSQAKGSQQQMERLRFRPRHALPNERLVLA